MADRQSNLSAVALATKHEFPAEKVPADCWDWITREDVTRLALVAFEMARKDSFPPRGERFVDDATGTRWAGRESFLETLVDCFSMRIKAMAHGYGLGEHFESEVKRLMLWEKNGKGAS